jgi:hypothetical protein
MKTAHGPFVPPTTDHDVQDEYWACTRPEAPADYDWTVYHLACERCRPALVVAAIHGPDEGIDVRSEIDPHGKTPWYGVDVLELLG